MYPIILFCPFTGALPLFDPHVVLPEIFPEGGVGQVLLKRDKRVSEFVKMLTVPKKNSGGQPINSYYWRGPPGSGRHFALSEIENFQY